MSDFGDRDGPLPPPLATAARLLAADVPAAPALLASVMSAVERRPVPRRTLAHRLVRRSALHASPLQLGLLAASIACFGMLVGRYSAERATPVAGRARGAQPPARMAASTAERPLLVTMAIEVATDGVHFVIDAPHVRQLSVVGDFNGWRPGATPLARDGSTGLWKLDLPIPAGRYNYAFVVDGRWTADPQSPRAPDDDFGRPNSVLVVNRQPSRS